MGIKKPCIIAYVGVCKCELCWHYFIHCAVLWTATEPMMDLPLTPKNLKMLSYQTKKMYKHRT